MLPPAPGLFSITTGCPRRSPSLPATARAEMSVDPAGGNGTTILMGLVGYDCADTRVDAASAAKPPAARVKMRGIVALLRVPGIVRPVYPKEFRRSARGYRVLSARSCDRC